MDRIIFIDADQVVRSDLMELVNLDLKGNVYAMTPFCKDKPEMARTVLGITIGRIILQGRITFQLYL